MLSSMRRFKFRTQHSLEEAQVRPSPFGISKDEAKSIVRDKLYLGDFGGLYGIARSLGVSLEMGVSAYDQPPITERRDYYGGSNQCIVTSTKTSIALVVFLLAFTPVFVVYKGLGIMLVVTLVVILAAFFLFKHYLIPETKVSVTVAVIRNRISNAISTTDLVVGDIIQLYAGEKVPADGIFIPGRKLLIREPANLTGAEGGLVEICRERPHLPAGSTVLSGSAKMLVTAVGMNTAVERMKPRYEHCMVLSGYLKMSALILKIKENLRVVFTAFKATFRFIAGEKKLPQVAREPDSESELSEEDRKAGFGIHPDKLASIIHNQDIKGLGSFGGLEGFASLVNVSMDKGAKLSDMSTRREIYGFNRFTKPPCRNFFMFVWKTFHDLTLIALMCFVVVSIVVGLATEGWPNGVFDGLGITFSIFSVVWVIAVCDYHKSFHFKDLDNERENTFVQVTRNGYGEVVSINELVVGDVVHLSRGDQVPADGVFISGNNLLVDESSLSVASEPVNICEEKPFLLAGTRVQDGSGKMLVTVVGMRTKLGRLMEISSGGDKDETPLKAESYGVATNIYSIGLVFAVLTLAVLTARFGHEFPSWSISNMLKLLSYLATVVIVTAVAVPVGLNLAETLSILFEIKRLLKDKLLKDRKLLRPLSTCEAIGSSTCISTAGDGTNDAPALHEADIGLAMGIAGTEVAKEKADMTISVDHATHALHVTRGGRAVRINIQKFVQFQLTVQLVALMFILSSTCISGSAPLLTIQLIWTNLVMDTLAALALAAETPYHEMRSIPPVGRGVSLITKAMWRNIIGQSIYQLTALLIFSFIGKQILELNGSAATEVLNTFIFNSFVFCQVFNEINRRDIYNINIFRGMSNNWIFVGITGSTVVFQVIMVEYLGTFARAVPLRRQLWLLSILIGFASLPVAVVLKCIPVEKETAKHHEGDPLLPSELA